jgi:hypothetical protein
VNFAPVPVFCRCLFLCFHRYARTTKNDVIATRNELFDVTATLKVEDDDDDLIVLMLEADDRDR